MFSVCCCWLLVVCGGGGGGGVCVCVRVCCCCCWVCVWGEGGSWGRGMVVVLSYVEECMEGEWTGKVEMTINMELPSPSSPTETLSGLIQI